MTSAVVVAAVADAVAIQHEDTKNEDDVDVDVLPATLLIIF